MMKLNFSRMSIVAGVVLVSALAIVPGPSVKEDATEVVVSFETQRANVESGADLESEPVEISAQEAPKPEPKESKTPESVSEAAEATEGDTLPAEDYEAVPEAPVDEEQEVMPDATETEQAEIPAEEFEKGEEDLCPTVLAFAREQLGESYVAGGSGPDQWDSSGLVQAAFSKAGIDLPRAGSAQAETGEPGTGAACDLAVSDGWIGISLGDGTVLGATNPRDGVAIKEAGFGGAVSYVDVLQ